jgi:hypothetical protein
VHGQPRRLGRRVLAPDLRPGQEEPLRRGEAVDPRAGGGRLQRVPRQAQPAVVGQVLAEREPAVERRAIVDPELRVLVDEARRARLVGRDVGVRPPRREVAVDVELAALVVEVMRDRRPRTTSAS